MFILFYFFLFFVKSFHAVFFGLTILLNAVRDFFFFFAFLCELIKTSGFFLCLIFACSSFPYSYFSSSLLHCDKTWRFKIFRAAFRGLRVIYLRKEFFHPDYSPDITPHIFINSFSKYWYSRNTQQFVNWLLKYRDANKSVTSKKSTRVLTGVFCGIKCFIAILSHFLFFIFFLNSFKTHQKHSVKTQIIFLPIVLKQIQNGWLCRQRGKNFCYERKMSHNCSVILFLVRVYI